jgi:hypothetical protein
MRKLPSRHDDDDDDRDDDRDEREDRQRTKRALPILPIAIGVLLVLGIAGGVVWYLNRGETTIAVIEKHRSQFADVRAKLKKLHASLPAKGTIRGDSLPANLKPELVYDVQTTRFNTAVLMAEQCEDPDRDLSAKGERNLNFHEDGFLRHLQWTGTKSPLVESGRRSPAKDLAQQFAQSLNLQYLVVVRTIRDTPVQAIGDKNFLGGEWEFEVFLFDFKTEKLLGGFRRSLVPDAQVMVTFTKDRKANESVEAFISSNVWSKARTEIATTLARGTGGTFVAERPR